MSTVFELHLRRRPSFRATTFGELFAGGVKLCWTLEDAVREIPGQAVSLWKLPGETAIPSGRYRVSLVESPKFGPDTLSINGVPGFTAIRIHAGNDDSHTEGCVLVGYAIVEDPDGDGGDLLDSRRALRDLKTKVLGQMALGAEVWITIENPDTAEAA